MDLNAWTVYWVTRLDKVHFTLEVLIMIFCFVFTYALLDWLVGGEGKEKTKTLVCIGLVFSFLVLMKVFTPTTKEFAAIIVLPALAQNQEIKDIGAEIPKLAREWLQELHPKQKD